VDQQSRIDWERCAPAAIPTKSDLSALETWCERFPDPSRTRILDLGCGNGEVARGLVRRGFSVTGVDINAAAVVLAGSAVAGAVFQVGDAASSTGGGLPAGPFDAVVCQLLLSIVGDAADRLQVLRNARAVLAAGGSLFASFSGRSEDVNPDYARLYRQDRPATGEDGTYLSRDGEGRVLYCTHHFRADEIRQLLEEAGFAAIEIRERIETSSRRHDQKARFFYASASSGGGF
jgi:SAM-dependent methyltransferase